MHHVAAFNHRVFGRDREEAARSVIFPGPSLHTQIGLEPGAYAIFPQSVIQPAAHISHGCFARMDDLARERAAREAVRDLHHLLVGGELFWNAGVEVLLDQFCRRHKMLDCVRAHLVRDQIVGIVRDAALDTSPRTVAERYLLRLILFVEFGQNFFGRTRFIGRLEKMLQVLLRKTGDGQLA